MEENEKYTGLKKAPVEELEKEGNKEGRPKVERMEALAKRDAERAAKSVVNKIVRDAGKKTKYEKKVAEGKIAPKGATRRAKAGKA